MKVLKQNKNIGKIFYNIRMWKDFQSKTQNTKITKERTDKFD